MTEFKKIQFKSELPHAFNNDTIASINRIEELHSVVGVLFLYKESPIMYSVSEMLALGLTHNLPVLNGVVSRAVTELDIQNELVAYRVITKSSEILVKPDDDFTACVVHRLKKRKSASK